jgi:arylsulfatase A-like enzyme/regulator of sirC expression with transglutaminase-like and TPR domain
MIVGALLAGASQVLWAQQSRRPNVLLVTLDTLRWDALGCYGGPAATPALDHLAAQGVRFETVTAHSVVTLPSHTTILTSLDPSRHGVHNNTGFRASEDLVTWAEHMKAAGYATGAFIGAFPLDSMFGLAQGFDVYDDYYSAGEIGSHFAIVERPGAEVVSAARGWIAQQGEGPWFAWVHIYDPHAPYEPPEPFATQYADDPYAGEVAATDFALAPLLQEVTSPDTLVVVTGDHGEGLGQHGEMTHGLFAYEQTLRAPLIFARPGHIRAGVVAQRVRHIDILPTVLDLLGLPAATGVQGESLSLLLAGDSRVADGRNAPGAYFEALTPYLTRGWAPLRGYRQDKYKFIDLPIPELYDLDEDPGELVNLATEDPRRVAIMRADLQDHLAAVGGGAITEVAAETAATLERLRSLGYVGSSAAPDPERVFDPGDDPKSLVHLDKMIHQAVNAGRVGQWKVAEEKLRGVVAERPNFSWAHSLLAGVLSQQGNRTGAIAHLEGVVEAGLVDPFLLNKLGYYLQSVGRFQQARDVLEVSIAEEPDNLETLNLLGGAYERTGQGELAIQTFQRALELDPSYASVLANYGTALLSLGRVDDAIAALQQAIQFDPKLPEPYNVLGVIAAQRGSLPVAVQNWQAAVELDPNLFDALFNLGTALVRLDRPEEAIPVLQSFIDRAPPARYAEDIERMRQLLLRIQQ